MNHIMVRMRQYARRTVWKVDGPKPVPPAERALKVVRSSDRAVPVVHTPRFDEQGRRLTLKGEVSRRGRRRQRTRTLINVRKEQCSVKPVLTLAMTKALLYHHLRDYIERPQVSRPAVVMMRDALEAGLMSNMRAGILIMANDGRRRLTGGDMRTARTVHEMSF